MKNLEDAQREMRERNARKRREEDFVQPEIAAADDSPEVVRLKREISALNEQVMALQMENNRKRVSNPPSQGAEPVLKCGYGSSDERSHGKTTDTARDSADSVRICNERHATE